MSQEALKNYTLQTLNLGNEFLSKLSQIQLPAELSEMKMKLSDCFMELNRIWNSVNKLAFRFNGDCGMGDLKFKLKQMEINQYEIPQIPLTKSKSIDNLAGDEDMRPKKLASQNSTTPSYANWSPNVPPKNIKRKVENSKSVAPRNNHFDKNEKSYMNVSGHASFQCKTENRTQVKPVTATLPRLSESFQRADSENPPTMSYEELDYLSLENERQLPEVRKFALVSKATNVVVNDWQLGERYCGISEEILYIFYSFQDPYAEISMGIPTIFIGKGFNLEKSVIFQSQDLQVKIYFSSEANQEKFYKATFQAQNIFNSQHVNPIHSLPKSPAPQMPKPYSKKEEGPCYLNTNVWSKRISRSRMATLKKTNRQYTTQADNAEEEYIDMVSLSTQISNSN